MPDDPPRRSDTEIFDELSQRLEQISEEKAAARLSSGWTQDEDGHWIPPGWVRKDAA